MQRTLVLIASIAALAGCGHSERSETVADEQSEERSELAQDQYEDRQDLAQDQASEREEVPADARDDLASQTEEANAARAEAEAETRRLEQLVVQACNTIPEPEQASCPLNRETIESMRNVDDGVSIGMKRNAGTADQIETRVNCFRARESLRTNQLSAAAAPAPDTATVECLAGFPDAEIDVNETRGRVFVEITAEEDGAVDVLRTHARELTARR